MTREELKEYRSLVAEKQEQEDKIIRLNNSIDSIKGKGTGSSKIFPYLPIHYTIDMIDEKQKKKVDRDLRKTKKILAERIEYLSEELVEIELFIQSIEDSETRRAFEMYFVDGMILEEIAKDMHKDISTVSRMITDYISLQTKQK